jgi:glycosyltransferase involved in cell wall biosynthesis
MPDAKKKSLKKKPLKITILLPLSGAHPVGGFKVAYEYANYLAKKGHRVSVVHPAIFRIDRRLGSLTRAAAMRTIRTYIANRLTGRFKPDSWFQVDPSVRLLWVPSLSAKHIPDGDIVVATAWETAEWAAEYPESKGKKFYLIQHLETWSGPDERVLATWKMPLRKIVIAGWLQAIAENLGETVDLIANGLDFERFKLLNAQDNRDPNNILMPFHAGLDWKGSADGLAAFALARAEAPGLRLTLFGRDAGPDNLPFEVEYHRDPAQHVLRDLYNQASMLVVPSWTEGFSLPPAEALQCGAAIVLTDFKGAAAYAVHEETALISPIKNPEALAGNILRLVRDPDLRLQLARNGHAAIQEFTWERAGSALESIFLRSIEPSGTTG